MELMQKRTLERLAPWFVTVSMFLLWEVICRLGGVPEYFLPAPTVIFDAMLIFHEALIEDSLYTCAHARDHEARTKALHE